MEVRLTGVGFGDLVQIAEFTLNKLSWTKSAGSPGLHQTVQSAASLSFFFFLITEEKTSGTCVRTFRDTTDLYTCRQPHNSSRRTVIKIMTECFSVWGE